MSETTIPDDAWKLPPLAPVTGCVELRNGEQRCVTVKDGYATDATLQVWQPGGSWLPAHYDARSLQDIVRQVSLAPTWPGVYETAEGWERILSWDARTAKWCVVHSGIEYDEFGRCYEMGVRSCGDLRRRIGDLPAEPEPVAAPQPSYTPEEAAAAMAAMMDGHETVPVRREDLRMLVSSYCALQGRHLNGFAYRVVSRLANCAEFRLPPWLTDYAREQGWSGGAE